MDTQEGLQLSDLAGVVTRRGRLVVYTAGAVLLLVYWIAMMLPNQYQASALILVEPQGISEELLAAGVRESDLSQRLGIMTSEILSRARLSDIISDFDLYPDMADWYTREEVVDHMREQLSIEPVFSDLQADQRRNRTGDFNTFRINFSYDSPQLAAEVVNRLSDDFISEHIDARVQVSQKSLEFMRSSMDDLRTQIARVEVEIKEIKEANPGRLPEDLMANQRIQQQMMMDYRNAQQLLAAARSDEAFWKNQVLTAVSLSSPNDPTSPQYRRKLLELELRELRSRGFTDRHPDIIRAEAELEALSMADSEAAQSTPIEQAEDKPPETFAEQNARSEHRRAKLQVAASQEEVRRLEAQLAEVEGRLGATPGVAEQLDRRQREYDSLRNSFQDFSAKLQQASVQANMERRQLGEQLRVLEAAVPPPSPTSPNRPLILALGLVLGLGFGLGLAVVVETGDRSVHNARELQGLVGLPVLAEIPRIMLESDRAERSRRLVIEGAVMLAIVFVSLFGGLLSYFYVNGAPGFLQSGDEYEQAAPPAQQSEYSPMRRGERLG